MLKLVILAVAISTARELKAHEFVHVRFEHSRPHAREIVGLDVEPFDARGRELLNPS